MSIPAGFGKLDRPGLGCILAANEAAVDHPVHLCIGPTSFQGCLWCFFAGRTTYDSAAYGPKN